MNRIKEQKALLNGGWYHMKEAPKHVLIEVFCPMFDGQEPTITFVMWDEYRGYKLDDFPEPVMWRYI